MTSHFSEWQLRVDLTTAFRWAARLNYHEATANHFSVSLSDDGKQFLLNPRGRHFSKIQASELILLNADDPTALHGENAPDPTAWYLHAHLHQHVPQARCILHTHMSYTTALCCLYNYEFLMLDQNACRFYNRIAYDRTFAGMALDDDEGKRIASLLGEDKNVLFMGNHGVIVVGRTVAEAFDDLYYLEKAAQVQVLALSTHQKLDLIPNEIAAKTCDQWVEYPQFSELHFDALKDILDTEEPGYKM